jgi:hypothetical protein
MILSSIYVEWQILKQLTVMNTIMFNFYYIIWIVKYVVKL